MAAPSGHPKWGGRQPGTPNKVNLEVRNRIEAEADPVGFLIKIVKGAKMRGELLPSWTSWGDLLPPSRKAPWAMKPRSPERPSVEIKKFPNLKLKDSP